MTGLDRDTLRALVREVVRDAVKDLPRPAPASAPASRPAPPPPAAPVASVAEQIGLTPTGPLAAEQKHRTDTVRLATDRDLDAFVRTLLRLFENPKTRADLKAGRLTFRLAGTAAGTGGQVRRIDSGAVTERHIAEIAATGAGLVLGPRAVLTPLAREKARALGVKIEKERR